MRKRVLLCVFAVLFIVALVYGYRTVQRIQKQADRAEALRGILKGVGLDNDVHAQQRSEMALSIRKNKVIDPEPILICAVLSKIYRGTEEMSLGFVTCDEDADLTGFGIREKSIGADGSDSVLLEEYPVFVHRRPSEGIDLRWMPVNIRASAQQKPTQRWQEYVQGAGVDKDRIHRATYWRETLPEVWVSVPEPNKVDVELYLYDAAGHKSQPVKLHCLSPPSSPK